VGWVAAYKKRKSATEFGNAENPQGGTKVHAILSNGVLSPNGATLADSRFAMIDNCYFGGVAGCSIGFRFSNRERAAIPVPPLLVVVIIRSAAW
jgi:hypothetical protein